MPLFIDMEIGKSLKVGDITIHFTKHPTASRKTIKCVCIGPRETRIDRLGFTEEAGATPEQLEQQRKKNE